METYIAKDQVNNYFKIPKTFDWELVDQEIGFGKVFKIFPKDVYSSLETSQPEIYKLLTKAGVYYSFIFSIPRLKVYIQNFGIQQFEVDKMKTAPWWDVRDLGLSMLKLADEMVSDAITAASKIEDLKNSLPFFQNTSEFIATPEEFQNIYSINYSPEMFSQLQPFIKKALLIFVYDKISKDCIIQIKENEELLSFLKDALVFYALYYASLLPGFVFTQNAVVIQYEELPWQKSIILDSHAKLLSGQNFKAIGDESIKIIIDYIKNNASSFPCYQEPQPERTIQSRDSGIYL